MATGIEKIADTATDGKLVDSRLMKIAEAMGKLHSAYTACDERNRKVFRDTIGKLTIIEAVRMFGEMDEVSAKIED
jgi:predicted secreted protein